jgi:ABC-type sugar transport system ATPase subunit
VTVAYPGGRALIDVSVGFTRGRVHVLAGENGAGKSTLIKLVTGARLPDRGHVSLDGTQVRLSTPAEAARLGIRVVQQELHVFGHLRVWENIGAARLARGGRRVDERALRRHAAAAIARIGADIPLETPVALLSPATQQMVAIAAALDGTASFLVLDEPTANLARPERERLLALIADLAAQGVGVIFVSHHLEEALAIGHDVTVLRDGRVVWAGLRTETTRERLVEAMFGGVVVATARRGATAHEGPDLLTVRGMRWGRGLRALDLHIRAGEVLCVAGLPGSDAESLTRAIGGGLPRRGSVLAGATVLPENVHGSIRDGRLALIPADRKHEGLFLDLSVAQNIAAGSLGASSRYRLLLDRIVTARAMRMIRQLRILPPDPVRPVRTLSGGNQQKVLLGRCLAVGIRILLADEPTRGVDIATKAEIHQLLRRFADDGGACVIYSSDLHEIGDIADRVLILGRDGAVQETGPARSAEELFSLMGEAA